MIKDLIAIRDVLAKGWCQGGFFRDSADNRCIMADAVKYCIQGALYKAINDDGRGSVKSAIQELVDRYIDWQDQPGRTQAEVLRLLDYVIKIEMFKDIKALISKGWSQGRMAKTADDLNTDSCNPNAVKFCLYGALCRVTSPFNWNWEMNLLEIIRSRDIFDNINFISWQDQPSRTKQEILELLDSIIESLIAEWRAF